MKRAGITAGDIDYINAHGTSTQMGDEIELKAVERLLGNAAGKVVDVLDQVRDRPPSRRRRRGRSDLLAARHPRRRRAADPQPRQSVGRDRRSTSCRIIAKERPIDIVLSNSFGFGGTNASLVFRRHA